MLGRRDDPFPYEAVRDLLGLVRTLHRAARASRAPALELERLEAVGRELRTALELATTSEPGTVGMRAAWTRAEDASRKLGTLVDAFTRAEPVVRAAQEAVFRASRTRRR